MSPPYEEGLGVDCAKPSAETGSSRGPQSSGPQRHHGIVALAGLGAFPFYETAQSGGESHQEGEQTLRHFFFFFFDFRISWSKSCSSFAV